MSLQTWAEKSLGWTRRPRQGQRVSREERADHFVFLLSVVQTRILTMRKARSPRRVLTGINLKGFKLKPDSTLTLLKKYDWQGDLYIWNQSCIGKIRLKWTYSFLKQYFARLSIDTIWGYLLLIFKLISADISWRYHQFVPIEDRTKHCFKTNALYQILDVPQLKVLKLSKLKKINQEQYNIF